MCERGNVSHAPPSSQRAIVAVDNSLFLSNPHSQAALSRSTSTVASVRQTTRKPAPCLYVVTAHKSNALLPAASYQHSPPCVHPLIHVAYVQRSASDTEEAVELQCVLWYIRTPSLTPRVTCQHPNLQTAIHLLNSRGTRLFDRENIEFGVLSLRLHPRNKRSLEASRCDAAPRAAFCNATASSERSCE